ncbi:MAG: gluconate:H+ symporter [Planctomycetaceae bacterium]
MPEASHGLDAMIPPLAVVPLAIVAMVAVVAWGRLHPFLGFIVVSAAAGAALGIPVEELPAVIRKGIGDVFGALAIVIVTGAMLGRLVVESGAAATIASTLVERFGRKKIAWAMAATGLVIGIPLFYGVGFMLVVPIIFAVTGRHGLPPLTVAVPALAAMSVAHGLLPPHPAPTALVAAFDGDLGRTLVLGLVIAVPAIVVAGPLFASTLRSVAATLPEGMPLDQVDGTHPPGLMLSVTTALFPAVMLSVAAIVSPLVSSDGAWAATFAFWTDADVVMIVSLAVAAVALGLARGRHLTDVMGSCGKGIGDVASILLVVAGSGAFKQVLVAGGVNDVLGEWLGQLPVHPLLLGWIVTAVIRICVGSATVAGLTSAGILEPLVASGGADPELMVLAIGAGSLACSHVNDGAFWMFKEYFNVSIADTFRSWTVMETIVSVVALAGVLVLDLLRVVPAVPV